MTILETHETPAAGVEPRQEDQWWRLPEIWGSLAISVMWLAVLFVSVYGGDMTFANPTDGTTAIPMGVVVAICAAFTSAAVARRTFRR